MKVGRNKVGLIDDVMRNAKGDVLENTAQAKPVSYLHGSSGIISLLQKQLQGLRKGDKIIVHLLKESGFTDEDFVFDVTIQDIRKAQREEIALGYPLSPGIEYCGTDCDCHNAEITNKHHKSTF